MDSTARDDASLPEIGKYNLIAELARGGMGVVYLAALQGPGGFNKLLALKELKAELCEDETYVSMFLDEARLAARLVHPNIVQTNEVGSEGRRHFMVMEFLDGRSLHRIARRGGEHGRLPPTALVRVVADALLGLHYAHELREFDGEPLGIVHRDVSPLNVFVTFDGQAKMLDFGIAKTVDSSLQTATGILKGRVAYMAPEQAWGNTVDRRADVYAAGVMLWEMAAGRRLWPGMSEVEILARILREGPPSLRSVKPDAPADLDAICARAMAKHPEERYPTAAALADDLEQHLSRQGDAMTMREIGAFVSRAFAEERGKMNMLIEKTLSRVRTGPRSGVMPTFEAEIVGGGTHSDSHALRDESGHVSSRRVRTPTSARPLVGRDSSELPAPLATTAVPPGLAPDDVRRPWVSNRVAVGLSLGALLASTLVVVAMRGPAPAPEPSIVAAGARAAGPSLAEVELVDVTVRVSPASALISIDGAPVPTNPFHARYMRDRSIHHIAASADGYDSKLEDVSFSGDVSVDVSLDHHAAPPAPHRAPAPPPPPPAPAPRSAKHPTAPSPPAEASSPPAPPSSQQPEVNPAGGRAPLRPILTSNPYGNP